MTENFDYLIIGGGVAGVTAATEIRNNRPDATIAILSQEPVCFYSRVLLTNYLEGTVKKEKLILRNEQWFCDEKINLILSDAAKSLDPVEHKVITASGREIIYKKLIIASGVSPRVLPVPGGDLPGVFNLWNLADAEHISAEIKKLKKLAREKQVVAVIGGGFICQSLVKIFTANDFETHLLMRGKYYWSKFIGEQAGGLITNKFNEKGIKTHLEMRTQEIVREKDGMLIIKTESGEEIKAGMIIVGVGTLPNTDWLEGSGIELDNGIKVNEYLETNLSDVYAAGDVVNFYDVILEDFHRKGNWVNASRQGEICAANMCGEKKEFNEITSFTVNIFSLNFTFLGEYNRTMADEVVVRDEGDKIREYYFKGERLIGATLLNAPMDRPLIEIAIKDKIKLSKSEQLSLSEDNIPLEESKIYGTK